MNSSTSIARGLQEAIEYEKTGHGTLKTDRVIVKEKHFSDEDSVIISKIEELIAELENKHEKVKKDGLEELAIESEILFLKNLKKKYEGNKNTF